MRDPRMISLLASFRDWCDEYGAGVNSQLWRLRDEADDLINKLRSRCPKCESPNVLGMSDPGDHCECGDCRHKFIVQQEPTNDAHSLQVHGADRRLLHA